MIWVVMVVMRIRVILFPLSVECSLTGRIHPTEQMQENGLGGGGRAVWTHLAHSWVGVLEITVSNSSKGGGE